jgi:hypothetical protein
VRDNWRACGLFVQKRTDSIKDIFSGNELRMSKRQTCPRARIGPWPTTRLRHTGHRALMTCLYLEVWSLRYCGFDTVGFTGLSFIERLNHFYLLFILFNEL